MKKVIMIGLVGFMSLFATVAQAIPLTLTQTIDLDTVYTGATPDGTSPWLTATFTFTPGTNTGVLALSSNLVNGNFVQGGTNINATIGWAFYLNPLDISSMSCQAASTNCADNIFMGGSYNSGSIPGTFNLSFSWNTNDRLMGGQNAIYDITFGSNLVTTSPFTENGSGWISVAHVQGIGTCSGWIVSGTGYAPGSDISANQCGQQVPEPNGLSIFFLGALGLILFGTMARRRLRC